jgi:hypothetical protein
MPAAAFTSSNEIFLPGAAIPTLSPAFKKGGVTIGKVINFITGKGQNKKAFCNGRLFTTYFL